MMLVGGWKVFGVFVGEFRGYSGVAFERFGRGLEGVFKRCSRAKSPPTSIELGP